MSSPADLYIEGIKKKLKNYYAAWLPNEVLRLGDVGTLDGKLFRRVTSLTDLGISFDERPDMSASPLDLTSSSGVSMTFKLEGETNSALPSVPQAEAGIGIEFGQEGSFVVKASETYEPSIANIAKLEKEILEAFKGGRWDKNWAVIVKIVKAPTANILISRSSNSKVELSARGDIKTGGLSLGNANLQFGLKSQSGDMINMVGATDVTPFFQLAGIKRRLFGGSSTGLLGEKRHEHPADPLSAVTPATADDSLYFDLVLDSDSK